MVRIVPVVLFFIIFQCSINTGVKAQSNNPCENTRTSIAFLPGCQCGPFEPFLFQCTCPTPKCAPSANEVKDRCNVGGQPVCLSDGNTYIEQTDCRIPGLGNGLSLVRTWNSQWPSTQMIMQVGLFGPNWRSSFEERIFMGSDGYEKYARADGSFWSFGVGSSGLVPVAPANVAASLTQGNTSWTLTFQNGEKRLFDNNSGSLTAIIDRNGNTTTLSYDSINRLVTVTDASSRHLNFAYGSSTSHLVTSITSDIGLSLSYAYDTKGRLTQVTKPDLTTLSFQYDSNSFITTVLDSNGKILESHTYDSNGRALTSSRVGGVEALTISYPTP
jgi:YD repeat-containing protein